MADFITPTPSRFSAPCTPGEGPERGPMGDVNASPSSFVRAASSAFAGLVAPGRARDVSGQGRAATGCEQRAAKPPPPAPSFGPAEAAPAGRGVHQNMPVFRMNM